MAAATAQQTSLQTNAPAQTSPASAGKEITARVIEVKGDASYLLPTEKDWKKCKVDDEYPQLTQMRTGIGGSLKLQVGSEAPYTAIVIDPISRMILSDATVTSSTKRVRVGVSHGRIRAGVAEGGLTSDFTVDSPVATLSKKGTWDFGLFYERGSDRFEIFLLDYGLVEALSKVTNEVQRLQPGEAVTQAMRRWGDEAQLRRNIALVDLFGQDNVELAFNRIRNDGLGVIDPGSGKSDLLNLRNTNATAEFRNLVDNQIRATPLVITPPPILPPTFVRPEGFFGTGRGDELLNVIIDQNNFLAREGYARPGTFRFRRSALEGWMNANR
ncbi:MAG: hypothetical protein AB7N71_11830 [Phycisphaerae bacterium]